MRYTSFYHTWDLQLTKEPEDSSELTPDFEGPFLQGYEGIQGRYFIYDSYSISRYTIGIIYDVLTVSNPITVDQFHVFFDVVGIFKIHNTKTSFHDTRNIFW